MKSRNHEYEITRRSYEMGQKRDRDRAEKFIMSGLVYHSACNLPSAGACM